MARGGPGGGAKAKVRSEDRSQRTKLTLSEGVKNEESESVEKGNPPFAPILLFPGTTAPCAARLQLNQGHHHDPRQTGYIKMQMDQLEQKVKEGFGPSEGRRVLYWFLRISTEKSEKSYLERLSR